MTVEKEVLAEHWFHDGGDTCECGYWAHLDVAKRIHIEDAFQAEREARETAAAPTRTAWAFGDDAAYRLIARTSWPFEREENRDAWAVTMRDRPELLATEVAAARARLEQAIDAVFPPGEVRD